MVFLDCHHYNSCALEKYHYYSPIRKDTITILVLSQQHHGVRIRWTRAQPQAYTPVRISVWPILPPAQEEKGVGLLCLPHPTAIVFLLRPSPFPRRCAIQTLADGGDSSSGAGGEKNQSEAHCDGPCRPQWVIRSRAFRCAVRWRWRTTTAGMDLPPPLVA